MKNALQNLPSMYWTCAIKSQDLDFFTISKISYIIKLPIIERKPLGSRDFVLNSWYPDIKVAGCMYVSPSVCTKEPR